MSDSFLPLTETITPADRPAAVEAVAEAVASAKYIYPLGGRTNLAYGANRSADGGRLPEGVGICTEKLNRVVDHADRDLTVTVEAGVTIAKLAKLLAAKNQRLPVDVPLAARATVGGAIASAQAGPRRFQNGTMRDYVIGFDAVDGTGKSFSGGGRVVKNAAGYDMCRLMTGSLGTLGLITQVTLMVKPIARRSAFLACDLTDLDTAERMLADLIESETLPAAVELLAGPAWSDDPALGKLDAGAARLLVGFEGSQADVDWMLEKLSRRWRQATDREPAVVSKSQVDPLWNRLTEFPLARENASGVGPLVVQISTLPSKLAGLIQKVQSLDPQVSIQAHAGDGVIKARFAVDESAIASGGLAKLLQERLRPVVAAAGGRMAVLSYPAGAELDQKAVWGLAGDNADKTVDGFSNGISVMRAIKDRFDPQGLLNPGRFIF